MILFQFITRKRDCSVNVEEQWRSGACNQFIFVLITRNKEYFVYVKGQQ